MKNKRIQNIFGVVGAVLLSTSIFYFYYHDRIDTMPENPGDFFSAAIYNLKRITGWSEFSWQMLAVNLSLTLCCLLIELLFTGWGKSSLKRLISGADNSIRGDLWIWLLDVLQLYKLFVLLFSFGVFYVAISLLVKSYNIHLITYITNPYKQFTIVLIASDLKHYIRHALSHKIGWFWELHKYHHSAEHLNMVTAHRGHFLEAAIISLFDAVLFVLIGAPAEMYLSVILIREAHLLFTHSEVQWKWGWLGKYILVSPAAHQIHHSALHEHHDKNYGNMFIFWDRIFNSWYNPENNKNVVKLGLTDNPYNKAGFMNDMFLGYRLFIGRVKSYFTKPVSDQSN